MNKIALIRPYYPEPIIQKSFPLGLGYLAAVLRKNGYFVRIYDLNILNIDNHQILRVLEKIDFDFVGISALTCDFLGMIELSNLIKEDSYLKNKKIILGGVHVTFLPEYSLRRTHADYVCIGEAEITIIELLDALKAGKDISNIKGIGYFKDNKYIQNEERELIKNLDSLPFPAWDLIHPENYKTVHGTFYKRKPVFPIFTTRGCPYQCEFCASKNFWHQRIRFRSIENIMEEIEFLEREFGAREIQIWDDNFTLNRKFVTDFCHEIIRRNIKLFFNCPNGVRIDTFDEDLLKLMRSAGFYQLIFAIESGSQKILNRIKKNLDISIVPNIIKLSKKNGFITQASFMIGLPTESLTDIYKTLNLSLSLPLDSTYYFIFNPLPGCTFFNDWVKTKNLDDIHWDFDFFTNPQDMGRFYNVKPEILPKLLIFFNIKFFLLRPWKIIRYFLRYKISQYKIIISRFVFLIKKHLKLL